jgi:DNA-binding transcriptional MerR regulator
VATQQHVRTAERERFYTVTQISAELGVTPRALRFYEAKGLLAPRRAGTTRVYTHRDRARMILILRGKRLGFSLREIRDFLDLYEADRSQREQLNMLVEAVCSRIGRLEEQRKALDDTLAELREIEAEARAGLEAVERGQVERGQVERGQVERGQVERGQVERGETVLAAAG